MVGFKSYIPTGTFSKAQFQMLLKMQKKKKGKEKIKGRYRLFAIHFQYTTMATQFFDGISRILFVTPSNICKICLTPKSTGSQIKSREGRNVLRWYSPIPIRRMEFNGVNGSPAESIHVHQNYWSCDEPNLRQMRYKPDMPRS